MLLATVAQPRETEEASIGAERSEIELEQLATVNVKQKRCNNIRGVFSGSKIIEVWYIC
jgi:hypothetical protein